MMRRAVFTRGAVTLFSAGLIVYASGCSSEKSAGSNGFDPRIINGTPASIVNVPQVAKLDLLFADLAGNGYQAGCTGTIIAPRKVLSAAHCFIGSTTVFISGMVTTANGEFPISGVVLHPGFVVDPFRGLLNDAAIVESAEDFGIPPAPVLVSRAVPSGTSVTIAGFGVTENGTSGELNLGTMVIDTVDENLLHATFDEQSNTCFGDSGGPAFAVISESASPAVVGISSAGTKLDCGPGDESTFTNLADPDVSSFLANSAPDAAYF